MDVSATSIKRLQALGRVLRQRDAADERRVLLHLTPKGRALRSRAAAVPPQLLQASQCSVAEVSALTRQLHALRQRLNDFNPRAA